MGGGGFCLYDKAPPPDQQVENGHVNDCIPAYWLHKKTCWPKLVGRVRFLTVRDNPHIASTEHCQWYICMKNDNKCAKIMKRVHLPFDIPICTIFFNVDGRAVKATPELCNNYFYYIMNAEN